MNRLAIAAAALLAGTAALAQTAPAPAPAPTPAPPATPAPMAHPMADKVMTRAEVVANVREHFTKLDTNKDGSVTKEEAMEGHDKLVKRFELKKGEGPHAVTIDGPVGDPNAAFDRLDANKDGSISRDEFTKAREQRIERRIVMREERKERREQATKDGEDVQRHVMRMHGPGFGSRMIVMADTDKDGKITMSEAEALALQHFDQMDSNKDGQVTPEERRAGRPMIMKRLKEKKTDS